MSRSLSTGVKSNNERSGNDSRTKKKYVVNTFEGQSSVLLAIFGYK